MKRKALAWCGVVLVAIVVALAWSISGTSDLPVFHSASVHFLDAERKEVSVILPATQREGLVHLFRGIREDRFPMKWVVFGDIRLFDEAGREVSRIEVFSNPGGPGPFRIGKRYFLGYDQSVFREMLRGAEADSTR